MAPSRTWLLVSFILLFNISFTLAQLPSTVFPGSTIPTTGQPSPTPNTGQSNGIISDAGAPSQQASISFSIESAAVPIDGQSTATSSPATGSDQSHTEHGLGLPAILGIALGVALVVISIMAFGVWAYMRRRQQLARDKRKSIMDAEFAQSLQSFPKFGEKPLPKTMIEKPLPTLEKVSEERLSRSSTIIASDAAEVAQINRKASMHQKKRRTFREKARDREKALKLLVGSGDKRESKTDAGNSNVSSPQTPCVDNNGDVFQHRPSKI